MIFEFDLFGVFALLFLALAVICFAVVSISAISNCWEVWRDEKRFADALRREKRGEYVDWYRWGGK